MGDRSVHAGDVRRSVVVTEDGNTVRLTCCSPCSALPCDWPCSNSRHSRLRAENSRLGQKKFPVRSPQNSRNLLKYHVISLLGGNISRLFPGSREFAPLALPHGPDRRHGQDAGGVEDRFEALEERLHRFQGALDRP